MIIVTRRRDLMGTMVNRRINTVAISAATLLITGLNGYLLVAL